jgi:hypothetical protein
MGGGSKGAAQLNAAALTANGRFFVSGALTPYDVENLCDQIVTLGRSDRDDVCVEVELGGMSPDSPELRALARRVKRLKSQGLSVRLHAARSRRKRFASLVQS